MRTSNSPKFNNIDFSFRPVVNPIHPEAIDEDDPFTLYHDVATVYFGIASVGDYMTVYCHHDGDHYTYFLGCEEYDQSDGPFGDHMVTVDKPMSMAEIIRLLETHEEGAAAISMFIYSSLEENGNVPVTTGSDIEVFSEVYPQLGEFYSILTTLIIDRVNERGEFPGEEELRGFVGEIVDGLP
jgi:hypothetical protein